LRPLSLVHFVSPSWQFPAGTLNKRSTLLVLEAQTMGETRRRHQVDANESTVRAAKVNRQEQPFPDLIYPPQDQGCESQRLFAFFCQR
jgi:hypothetical protein